MQFLGNAITRADVNGNAIAQFGGITVDQFTAYYVIGIAITAIIAAVLARRF